MSNPEIFSVIYASTAVGVGIILAAAALGSALGWGIICSKYLEGIARQAEMKPTLMTQMLLTGGLMEAFPMIALGIAMWFATANPFIGAMQGLLGAGGH
jgi:F-type H+-transporting ATPase subunit c